ncbi:hypothetical protein niasHT_031602 [Heterodera trifolii]|uniref:Uncharacterized protein n=1 Tax=Heterodera trifolii TaxID=157864 RepID=A0ABD2J017_9BILA
MNERQRGTNLAERWLTKTAWPAVWCQELIGREKKRKKGPIQFEFGRLRVERLREGEEAQERRGGHGQSVRRASKGQSRHLRTFVKQVAYDPNTKSQLVAEHKDKVPIDQRRTVPFLPSPIINLATQLKPINHKDHEKRASQTATLRGLKTEQCQRTERLVD